MRPRDFKRMTLRTHEISTMRFFGWPSVILRTERPKGPSSTRPASYHYQTSEPTGANERTTFEIDSHDHAHISVDESM